MKCRFCGKEKSRKGNVFYSDDQVKWHERECSKNPVNIRKKPLPDFVGQPLQYPPYSSVNDPKRCVTMVTDEYGIKHHPYKPRGS